MGDIGKTPGERALLKVAICATYIVSAFRWLWCKVRGKPAPKIGLD